MFLFSLTIFVMHELLYVSIHKICSLQFIIQILGKKEKNTFSPSFTQHQICPTWVVSNKESSL